MQVASVALSCLVVSWGSCRDENGKPLIYCTLMFVNVSYSGEDVHLYVSPRFNREHVRLLGFGEQGRCRARCETPPEGKATRRQ